MDNLSGMQLGPYQILQRMGQGGMATVYRATWLGHNMEVAVKVLPPSLAETPEFVARFKREADALARLQHPYIVPLIDFGEFGGYLFMVMPIMTGGMLANRIKAQGVLPLSEIQKVIAQVGSALEHAHHQSMIHRDVKPANILIDDQGHYRLTDFGIAKLYEATGRFTNTGTLLGTPTYMSPEQARGKPLDHRSDLYSLGVVLYEMATGRVPFQAETPIAVVFMQIEDTLPPPRSLNPAIPPKLEKVIQKTLAKKPEDRYQSMKELIQALQAVGEANIVPIAPSSTLKAQTPAAPTQAKPATPQMGTAKPATPLPSASAKPPTPPPGSLAKPVTPPPAPAPTGALPQKSGLPTWLWGVGAVVGLLGLIACVVSLLASSLPAAFAPPTLTPSLTPAPASTATRRAIATTTPSPETLAASATPIPVIWQIINDALANPLAQGQTIVAEAGTPVLLSITDLASGNAAHLHLLRGEGAVTLDQSQLVVSLAPESDALINSHPFTRGVLFKPQLANYPDLAFAGQGCLAVAYAATENKLILGCYSGTCQYVVAPEFEAWTTVSSGKQVVLTLDTLATKVGNILDNTRTRYRAALRQSTLGLEDETACLGSQAGATAVVFTVTPSKVQPTSPPVAATNTQDSSVKATAPPPPAATNTSPPIVTPPTSTPEPPTLEPPTMPPPPSDTPTPDLGGTRAP